MEKQLLQTRAFQSAFNVDMPDKPTMLEIERRELRQRLLEEEVKELRTAETMEDFSDAIVDSLYILFGTAHEAGIADRLSMLFDEVHKANMRKMGEDGKPIYREDGKVLKPEGWKPPNLKIILNRRFHLFKGETPELKEQLQAIREHESKIWENRKEKELKKHLTIFGKFSLWLIKKLENGIKRRVSIDVSIDENVNEVITYTSKRGTTSISDGSESF
jgi:predicted HAD superfamily Cof-like phosphohydrolase